jgi:calcineurin-like phosphoesterase family protein
MNSYFWADTHFYHYRMAKFRGYYDCDEEYSEIVDEATLKMIREATLKMNEVMISEWNSTVKPKDTIYFLGDLVIGNKQQTQEILNRLNGNICIIRGNHDHYIYKCSGVGWFKDVYMLKSKSTHRLSLGGNILIWLSHYAHRKWDRSHYGTLHLYGHSHGKLYDDPCSLSMDVGYDSRKIKSPYSLDEILYLLNKKSGDIVS